LRGRATDDPIILPSLYNELRGGIAALSLGCTETLAARVELARILIVASLLSTSGAPLFDFLQNVIDSRRAEGILTIDEISKASLPDGCQRSRYSAWGARP
jgi:hypothetical protein